MGRTLLAAVLVLSASLAAGQPAPAPPPSDEDLSIDAFLQALQTAIATTDREAWVALLSPGADREQAVEFFDAMVPHGVTRAVVRERDRAELAGVLPGDGFRLVAEVFLETGPRGRIATWRLDIRRPRTEQPQPQPWRIVAEDRLSSIEGLHRLSLQPDKQFAADNLVIRSVDFELRLPAGDVFIVETAEGITGMVLLGDGTMVFTPAPPEERGQVRLYAGTDTIDTPFTTAFVRLNPFELDARFDEAALRPVAVDERAFRRAQEVFNEEVAKSFSLDLSDLSRETWSLLPQTGDFLAEVRTRRFDALTYARSTGEPEDVSLFQRSRRKNISIYASEEKLRSRGEFYNENDLAEYDVTDYNLDVQFDPEREWLDGRARLKVRVKVYALAALTLRLADTFTVSSITSDELGRLLYLRVRDQNLIVVNLPTPVARDLELTLAVTYHGRVERQPIDQESVEQQGRRPQRDDIPMILPDPNWLLSNRNLWYPQGTVTDYATATIRFTVPLPMAVVATGAQVPGTPVLVPATPAQPAPHALYVFTTQQPVRYLGAVVSELSPIDAATVALDIVPPPGTGHDAAAGGVPPVGSRNTIRLAVEGNRRQVERGREALVTAADILRCYASIIGDVPYDSVTLAMVESNLPGGHSPAFFAMLNNPLPTSPFVWRNDPAAFNGFPEFFIAHELAHQWWGQAIGWQNYHEQWLSEGFAQYFAALYAEQRRGEGAFRDILEQFRRWSLEQSDQGAVYLGYRLGHIKSDSRVFRALVYNKGAAVLHMLRLIVGDDAFFTGIRRFYADNRFTKTGTDDLQRAMEAASGRSLERFFRKWIFESGVPRLRVSTRIDGQAATVRVEQLNDVFDVPLTVSLRLADGSTVDHVVVISEAVVEARIEAPSEVRRVSVNEDHATLATIDKG